MCRGWEVLLLCAVLRMVSAIWKSNVRELTMVVATWNNDVMGLAMMDSNRMRRTGSTHGALTAVLSQVLGRNAPKALWHRFLDSTPNNNAQ